MARSTMANLILRMRDLINDAPGASQVWTDDQIQGVMDASRQDIGNAVLTAFPTYSGSTIQYLDYYSDWTDWEDDVVLKQYLTQTVTPSASENIVGHWTFATNKFPPVYISGKTYDVYRSAADLLERWAAKWVLSYSFSSDGQSFQRQQAATMLQALAKTYRQKQRPRTIIATRSDLTAKEQTSANGLGATAIDYMSSGSGS